jgi:hypothetical protein
MSALPIAKYLAQGDRVRQRYILRKKFPVGRTIAQDAALHGAQGLFSTGFPGRASGTKSLWFQYQNSPPIAAISPMQNTTQKKTVRKVSFFREW